MLLPRDLRAIKTFIPNGRDDTASVHGDSLPLSGAAVVAQGNRDAWSLSTAVSKAAPAEGIPAYVRSVTLLSMNDRRPPILASPRAPTGCEAAQPACGSQSGQAKRHVIAGRPGSRIR
jgi:hypothetical protein